jgi:excisionase family DNA binding protein
VNKVYNLAMFQNMLTTKECSERLGVTRQRVMALIHQGRLKSTIMLGMHLVKEKDFAKLVIRPYRRPDYSTRKNAK